jgi:hypothetical protein
MPINTTASNNNKGNKSGISIARQFFVGRSDSRIEMVSLEYFTLLRDRESNAVLEHKSAQIIQKMFRGVGTRIALSVLRRAVLRIQSALRVFVRGRREYLRIFHEEKNARMTLYNRSAILIQKTWRGYKSRKNNRHLTQSVRRQYFDSIKIKVSAIDGLNLKICMNNVFSLGNGGEEDGRVAT